ncbi:hypothetical protein [Novosphingobium sp. PY1]|uniref:hypothetical protein n=1 Tax=Novosphingobium sp. PY1 TaxID=1882221 RepID=UPI001A8E10BE|nr:hypothetical protein [Novosphingobium sp. PY1]GFM28601.1 2-nitropropane dioxygenase [Novosphingobium sp. PY1]
MREISELSDKELTALENNYIEKRLESGGPYSLAEVRLEKMRRLPTTLDPVLVARKIVELAKGSSDHLTTYGDLWKSINPDQPWKGNATQQIVANALGRVIAYCVTNGLPILTTLVVRGSSRRLSDEAIGHICSEAKALGVAIGPDPKDFVEKQREAAIRLTEFPME